MIREERDSLLEVTDQQKKKIGFLENQVKADQEEKEKLALKAEQLENEKNEIGQYTKSYSAPLLSHSI